MSSSVQTPWPGNGPGTVGVVVLAAGRSARMGKPKLLLPWGDNTVLGHLLLQWHALATRQIAVVCAAGDQALQTELDRLGFPTAHRICNPTPERGMFSSIQCAAQWPAWEQKLTHWAIALGDQPLVHLSTLRHLLDFSATRPEKICQPARGGHGRHPVVLPQEAFLGLADSTARSLREFLETRAKQIALWPADDPGLDLDIDRPEDYENALRLSVKQELNPGTIPVNNGSTKYEPG